MAKKTTKSEPAKAKRAAKNAAVEHEVADASIRSTQVADDGSSNGLHQQSLDRESKQRQERLAAIAERLPPDTLDKMAVQPPKEWLAERSWD